MFNKKDTCKKDKKRKKSAEKEKGRMGGWEGQSVIYILRLHARGWEGCIQNNKWQCLFCTRDVSPQTVQMVFI